jgi:lysylphosphatidylglycerol synthetase-like protein (DUF2156 family)
MEQEEIVKQVRRWGGPASNAVLDESTMIFSHPDIDGIIGYRIELGAAIVYGDPICPPSETEKIVKAFHEFCEQSNLSIIYITASQTFADLSMNKTCHGLVQFGHEVIMDPYHDPRALTGDHASLVRRKVRHAEHENVLCIEYVRPDAKIEKEMEEVAAIWLKARSGPQIYLSHVSLFSNREGKRWFYAHKNHKVVGVIVLNQLIEKKGWLMNHLMITPDAPHGTPELLVTSAIDTLRVEGCRYVTCGSVPSCDLPTIIGPGKVGAWITRQVFAVSRKVFNLSSRMKFWEKYAPYTVPSYLLFSRPHISLKDIWAILRAMNAG